MSILGFLGFAKKRSSDRQSVGLTNKMLMAQVEVLEAALVQAGKQINSEKERGDALLTALDKARNDLNSANLKIKKLQNEIRKINGEAKQLWGMVIDG